MPELKLLLISDLTEFINKIEDIVDTVLQTLQQHIQKNSSNRTKTMDLGTFFNHVFIWAENLWHDRVEATAEDNDPSSEQPKKSLDVQKPVNGKATYPGQPLSLEQKEFAFG